MYKIVKILGKDYILYSSGKLFDIENGVYKKQHLTKRGYLDYCFCGDGEKLYKSVHRLIAEAFIPNPDNKPCIDHINTDRSDNRIENLRWVTHQENMNNPITYKRVNDAKKKGIIGLDKNGNEVCRYPSVADAVEDGYSNHIGEVANGRRYKSNNLFWRWE